MTRRAFGPPPTQERVKEAFFYEPAAGTLLRRVNSRRRPNMLVPTGSINAQGYVAVHLDGRTYLAHRLAWLYVHGEWPPELDHINGCRTDNRMNNLRSVDRSTNAQNRRSSSSGKRNQLPLGISLVTRLSSKPYTTRITIDGKSVHLGYFATPGEAEDAYLAAKRAHHRGCTI